MGGCTSKAGTEEDAAGGEKYQEDGVLKRESVTSDNVRSDSIVPVGKEAKKEKLKGAEEGMVGDEDAAAEAKGQARKRAASISVAALDNETIIEVFPEEMTMLDGILDEINSAFSMDELTRLYADFKMNGESITEADFGIIFATFSRTGTAAGMADVAFEMLDTSHDGKLQFSEFIKFIAVLVKGETEDKLKLCFSLFAGGSAAAESTELSRQDLVTLLAKLPLDKISGPSGDGIAEDAAGLQEIGEVDEEDADALNTMEAEREAAAANVSDSVDGSTPQTGTVMTLKRKRKSYANPIMTAKAEKVVDEAFGDLGKKSEESLNLQEFMALCEGSGVADYFAPF